ncbi:hypothetical protein FGU63_14530 [Edwardsiella ictaluri]|nr:hypothetical protein FGU63_14530 [Edwardsiella ictaluri]
MLFINMGLFIFVSYRYWIGESLDMILCKCLFSEVTVQVVTELDNKATHRHTPVHAAISIVFQAVHTYNRRVDSLR